MPSCDLCNIRLSSESLLEGHIRGKRHQQRMAKHNALQSLARRSVFLSKFIHPVSEEQVEESLREYGKVERVILDRNLSSFAIVEFSDEKIASWLVNDVKSIRIGQNEVSIRERKVDFSERPSSHPSVILADEVMKYLRECNGDFESKAISLVAHLSISKSNIESRMAFAANLRDYLQKSFADAVNVHLFGSSVNGTGTAFSDMDLDFVFENTQCSIRAAGGPSDLLACSTTAMKERMGKISRHDFYKLTIPERAKLLGRLANAFRKESGEITNIGIVPGAKCPLVRFDLKHMHYLACELSVDNRLGEYKADFIRYIIDADVSGLIRNLIFVLKLWADCNSLLTAVETNVPKSHWSSYTISLMAISFLQSIGVVGPVKTKPNSVEVARWKVEYTVKVQDIRGQTLLSLLRKFLCFTYDIVKQSERRVFSISDARVYTTDEFAFADNSFKLSLANVQDPLEHSHNTAANVSQQFVSLLRRKLMYSIVAMKQKPEDLAQLFDLDQLQKEMELSTINSLKSKENVILISDLRVPYTIAKERVLSLLEDVLIMEVKSEPTQKKTRMADSPNAKLDEDDVLEGETVEVMTHSPVWIGRRPVRRNLSRQYPYVNGLQLEREVSREISRTRQEEHNSTRFRLQLYNRHAEDDGEGELLCVFHETAEGTADRGLFQEVYHFLQTFIPMHLHSEWWERPENAMESNTSQNQEYSHDVEME